MCMSLASAGLNPLGKWTRSKGLPTFDLIDDLGSVMQYGNVKGAEGNKTPILPPIGPIDYTPRPPAKGVQQPGGTTVFTSPSTNRIVG